MNLPSPSTQLHYPNSRIILICHAEPQGQIAINQQKWRTKARITLPVSIVSIQWVSSRQSRSCVFFPLYLPTVASLSTLSVKLLPKSGSHAAFWNTGN